MFKATSISGTRHHYPNAIQTTKREKKNNAIKHRYTFFSSFFAIVKLLNRKSAIHYTQFSFFFLLSVMGAGSLITWNRILIELETARLPFMSYLNWEWRERKREREGGRERGSGAACLR